MELSIKTKTLIKKDITLKRKLEDHHRRSPDTMKRWYNNNNEKLITLPSLKIISEYLKCDMLDLVN